MPLSASASPSRLPVSRKSLSACSRWSHEHDDSLGLLRGGLDQHRRALFDRYLGCMLRRDRGVRAGGDAGAVVAARVSPAACYRGLVWLARLMNARGETIFYPDWFTAAWLPGPRPPWSLPNRPPVSNVAKLAGWRRIAVALTYGVTAGLIIGVAYGLQAWLAGRRAITDDAGLDVPVGYTVLVAAAVCFFVTLVVVLLFDAAQDQVIKRVTRWRGHAIRGLIYGSILFTSGAQQGSRYGASRRAGARADRRTGRRPHLWAGSRRDLGPVARFGLLARKDRQHAARRPMAMVMAPHQVGPPHRPLGGKAGRPATRQPAEIPRPRRRPHAAAPHWWWLPVPASHSPGTHRHAGPGAPAQWPCTQPAHGRQVNARAAKHVRRPTVMTRW